MASLEVELEQRLPHDLLSTMLAPSGVDAVDLVAGKEPVEIGGRLKGPWHFEDDRLFARLFLS